MVCRTPDRHHRPGDGQRLRPVAQRAHQCAPAGGIVAREPEQPAGARPDDELAGGRRRWLDAQPPEDQPGRRPGPLQDRLVAQRGVGGRLCAR